MKSFTRDSSDFHVDFTLSGNSDRATGIKGTLYVFEDLILLMRIADDLADNLPDQSEAFYLEALERAAHLLTADVAKALVLPNLMQLYDRYDMAEQSERIRRQLLKAGSI